MNSLLKQVGTVVLLQMLLKQELIVNSGRLSDVEEYTFDSFVSQ